MASGFTLKRLRFLRHSRKASSRFSVCPLVTLIPCHRDIPINISAYAPDIPDELPFTRIYYDGDEGLSNDWRIREQWRPSAAWADLQATAPPVRAMLYPSLV